MLISCDLYVMPPLVLKNEVGLISPEGYLAKANDSLLPVFGEFIEPLLKGAKEMSVSPMPRRIFSYSMGSLTSRINGFSLFVVFRLTSRQGIPFILHFILFCMMCALAMKIIFHGTVPLNNN
jgi:hypothetical protein